MVDTTLSITGVFTDRGIGTAIIDKNRAFEPGIHNCNGFKCNGIKVNNFIYSNDTF